MNWGCALGPNLPFGNICKCNANYFMYHQKNWSDWSLVKVYLLELHPEQTVLKKHNRSPLGGKAPFNALFYYSKTLPMLVLALLFSSHLSAFRFGEIKRAWPPVGVSYSAIHFHFSHTSHPPHISISLVTHYVEKCYFRISYISISSRSCFHGKNSRLLVVVNGVVRCSRWIAEV